MAPTSEAPPDTTMMRTVHDAPRRDLARANEVLADAGTLGGDQRCAIGTHLEWMMGFLRAHHASEDNGLYRLAGERADPAARLVLDRMRADHHAVAAAISEVDLAAAALRADRSDDAVRRTATALCALVVVLRPHLQAEEDDAMPIVSRLISAAEWQAIEKEHNLDPKSTSELGFEGHWLIDGSTDADRATVLGLVPPIPRRLMLH